MQEEPNAKVLQAAEEAIKDSDHRLQLLQEMWQSLGINPNVGAELFGHTDVTLVQSAEQELLTEVNRLRSNHPHSLEEGKRFRRPPRMRGIIV
ncbi:MULTISPECIES: LcrG family type III secretion system chaperone [Photorhabdus]|uniref:Type III secretion protein LcrG n=3 Tax=Photorhabdus khanii TaxID=1004150 RepID=A0A4R4K473_9GAMM|nr:LcrG family type III secretion system chaperone [Photorhabdus khanii]ETS33212.1 type III secretion protein LcrG [Photorhabdus khanii NC19]MQL47903.1 type III secretion protein LcrG [Photorhabdus khanii]OHV53489.1 type III secretion protein LcrG [Photorhabdus temperata]TDB62214.1 type III secretion protein LcrG [Photorhabdus khanii subsp. guanajuatensis]